MIVSQDFMPRTPESVTTACVRKDRLEVDMLTAVPGQIEALRQLNRQMDE